MQEYSFTTYWKNEKTSDVVISADRKSVSYTIYNHEVAKAPFGFEDPTVEQMYHFLEERCMPRRPGQLQEYLDYLGLDEYNPWEIVKITHGVMWEDFLWLKFPGESITWEDVKLRD
ncbi:MAG: hypothetical protein LUC41_02625 [Clostridiales bacterium]|nr:hypothetical protein [Clostridiales bacterium]